VTECRGGHCIEKRGDGVRSPWQFPVILSDSEESRTHQGDVLL